MKFEDWWDRLLYWCLSTIKYEKRILNTKIRGTDVVTLVFSHEYEDCEDNLLDLGVLLLERDGITNDYTLRATESGIVYLQEAADRFDAAHPALRTILHAFIKTQMKKLEEAEH